MLRKLLLLLVVIPTMLFAQTEKRTYLQEGVKYYIVGIMAADTKVDIPKNENKYIVRNGNKIHVNVDKSSGLDYTLLKFENYILGVYNWTIKTSSGSTKDASFFTLEDEIVAWLGDYKYFLDLPLSLTSSISQEIRDKDNSYEVELFIAKKGNAIDFGFALNNTLQNREIAIFSLQDYTYTIFRNYLWVSKNGKIIIEFEDLTNSEEISLTYYDDDKIIAYGSWKKENSNVTFASIIKLFREAESKGLIHEKRKEKLDTPAQNTAPKFGLG